jgi:hypothetical protein
MEGKAMQRAVRYDDAMIRAGEILPERSHELTVKFLQMRGDVSQAP